MRITWGTVLAAAVATTLIAEPGVYGQFAQAPQADQQYESQQNSSQYPPYSQGQYPVPGQSAPVPPNSQEQNALGNDQQTGNDQQHGVARLSIVQGDVNVKRGDNGELVAAIMNAPIMTQDHLQTSEGSRAEVELDYGNIVRLAPNTDLGFADLEYQRFQLQLGTGTIVYRVLRNSNAQAEIDTPSIAIRPEQQGEYRISVLDDGTTQITVRSGQLQIFSPRGSQEITAGKTVLVRGNSSDPEFRESYEVARDQFDDWCTNRDQALLASQSYRYVSPDVDGADDLDAYGKWVPSQYGQVWEPQPPVADWSPYSYGEWAYEPYYGWSWVDYAPWGWAPYHYGRWFWNSGFGWCWWPGAIGGRYFWNPALVGFFGWGGGGFGFGFGFGGLGWVALAPFEVFHPWWGHGFGYRGDFGFVRGANIAAMYRNAAFRGGAMTGGYNGFGGPSHRFTPATRAQLTNATFFRGQMPVSPTRASYQFSNRTAVGNARLASAENRQFFVHQQPRSQAGVTGSRFAAASPNSTRFAEQQNAHGVAPNLQAGYGSRGNYSASPNAANSGWQRFGDPSRSNTYRQNFAAGAQERSGWHSFGAPANNGARPATQPNYGRSYNPGTYGGNYQARPQAVAPASPRENYGAYGARPSYNAPRYSAPSMPYSAPRYATPQYSAPHYSAPRYSAPAAPHYSAPAAPRGGGGGSAPRGGGGRGGGGGHPSSGGRHGR